MLSIIKKEYFMIETLISYALQFVHLFILFQVKDSIRYCSELKLRLNLISQKLLYICMKNNVIRIVVVGDEGVGKTSLVSAIISDLTSQMPKIHKKVILPPDMCAYSKDIFTQIVDTASTSDITGEIKQSDIVLLVYDVSNHQSIMRLKEHWLPIINQISKEIPVVIVGNKCDKVELRVDQRQQYTQVRDVLKGLVRNFKQVQMGIQCSANYDKKIKQVLNSAQRAVLYPLGPLYDLSNKQITQKFRKALMRIFRILDKDLSGSLSDADLAGLQQRVFQTQLSSEDIRSIKNVIQKQINQELSNSISEEGFIAFQKKCIQMLKIQICWSILRHFDYNNNLQIKSFEDSFVINYIEGQSLELSPHVLEFLHKAFVFAQRVDPVNPMRRLFEPSPKNYLPEFMQEGLTLERYILLWNFFVFYDYRECYRALLYIGYDRKLEECFIVTRGKSTYTDLLKIKQRKIYSILFIDDKQYSGYVGSLFGKNSIEQGYCTRSIQLYSSPSTSKVLILLRIREHHVKVFLQQSQFAKKIDLIVHFANQRSQARQRQLKCYPSHIMKKQITHQIAQRQIKLFDIPRIDLQSLPIKIKQHPSDRLIEYLIKLFTNVEQGYEPAYIEVLKSESKKFKNILVGMASTAAIIAVGFFFNRKKLGI